MTTNQTIAYICPINIIYSMDNYRLSKVCRLFVQWTPVVGAVVMMWHVFALICGFGSDIVEIFVDSSLLSVILFMLASYSFHFCLWHRACILYGYAVSLCIDYQRNFGFGEYINQARWIVLVVGLIIVIAFFINCLGRCASGVQDEN